MNFKKIFRTLVCLVLVCALLVGVSPIRAKAVVPESLAVTAGIVIGSVLLGLGVGMAAESTSEVLTDMVVSCQDFLTLNYDFVTDEQKIEVWSTGSLDIPYVVDQSLIEAIRTWMFDSFAINTETGEISSVVEEEVEVDVPSGFASYNGHVLPDISSKSSNYDYSAIVLSSNSYFLFVSDSPFYFKYALSGSENATIFCDGYHSIYSYSSGKNSWTHSNSSSGSGWQYYPEQLVWTNMDVYGATTYNGPIDSHILSGSSPITSDYTTTEKKTTPLYTSTGYIAAENIPLSEGYADWAAGVTSIPKEDGEEAVITGFPVGLAPTLGDTLGLSQTDVWQGVSTYEQTGGEITDPDDGDDSGNLTLGDVTLTTFTAKLLADLTRALMGDSPKTLSEILGSQMIEVRAMIGELQSELTRALADIGTYIQSLPQSFADFFTQNLEALQTHFGALTQSIESAFAELGELIQTGFANLVESMTSLFEDLKNAIQEGFDSLVKPEKDYLTDKVNALCSEFAFADSIVRTAKELKIGLAGVTTEPPVIYIDLGATRGSYDIGGMVPFIDMRWYEEFKPTADALISAFLWICFVWRMLIHLPGIISGASGIFTLSPMPSTHTSPDKPIVYGTSADPSYEELLEWFFDGPEPEDWGPGMKEYYRAHPPTYEELLKEYHDPLNAAD